jgi:site-specific recombinase XerD
MDEEIILMPEFEGLAAVTMRIDENPAAIYLSGLKESGRRSMRQALNLVASLLTGQADALSCPWSTLRFQHISAVRAKMESQYKPATVNKTLAALRGVLRAAWQSGQMTAEDYQKAVSVRSVKNTTLPAGRELTSGELASLMATCERDRTPAGARDAAIIGTMYAAGLRREEVIKLDLADYDSQAGQLIIRGKGNKERTAYLPTGGAQALGDWLRVRGSESGPLFYCVNKGGRLIPKRMTSQAIYNLLDKRSKQAGVKDFSPHDVRRTFVSDLLDSGADIVTVAKMAGHASVTTTARYDRRPEEAKRKAASLLHVPYRGRE